MRTWLLVPVAGLLGCPASVGTVCTPEDDAAARRVVYQADGTPAYEGQALMLMSCGGQSFCHTQSTGESVRRFGAPFDLNFDPLVVDDCAEVEPQLERLAEARTLTYRHRNAIYTSVVNGTMPPRDQTRGTAPFRSYDGPSDTVGAALPAIQSAEGREILRRWLACGAQVVEATRDVGAVCTSDAMCTAGTCEEGVCAVGSVVAARASTAGATWPDIYASILGPRCATSGCHTAESRAGSLDLSTASVAYAALMATATGCTSRYVVPGDPAASYLFDKVSSEAPACGGPMPPAESLCSDDVARIRAWIMAGATQGS